MMLLRNPTIITMDAERKVLFGKSILIKGNKIAGIGDEKALGREHDLRRCRKIDCRNKLVIPGLINAHTHVAMSLFKGTWHLGWRHIYDLMFPAEKQLKGPDVYRLARLGILEMLKGGTTCFADHYYFIKDVARAARSFGMRGVLGHTLMDIEGPHRGNKEFKRAMAFNEKYSGDGLITPCLAPHATETVSPAYLKKIIGEAAKKGLLVHMHVAQAKKEYDYIQKTYAKTPVEYLRDAGAFEARFMGAHCIYLTAKDIAIFAKNDVGMAFTPSSEIMFEKVPDVREMMEAGVNVALGTDAVATSDFMSPLHEMKKAFYSMAQKYGPRHLPKPIEILEMSTINAAKALGMADKIGSIEEGKLADLLILDSRDIAFNPVYDVYANLVLCSMESMIEKVMVDGKIVLGDKKPAGSSAQEIVREATLCARGIMTRVFRKNKGFRKLEYFRRAPKWRRGS